METKITLDTTIPIWGVLSAMIVGAFFIIKMHFKIEMLNKLLGDNMKELKDIKELIHELLIKK
jgi:hypothetical protein